MPWPSNLVAALKARTSGNKRASAVVEPFTPLMIFRIVVTKPSPLIDASSVEPTIASSSARTCLCGDNN